jgi:hypothetical protein
MWNHTKRATRKRKARKKLFQEAAFPRRKIRKRGYRNERRC